MENNKSFFAPSRSKAAITYIISLFVLVALFAIIIALIIANYKGVDKTAVKDIFLSPKGKTFTDEVQSIKYVATGWSNFICYSISLAGIIIWMRNDFITDYQGLLANKKRYAIFIPIAAIAFTVIAVGVDRLSRLVVDTSQNQKTIVALLHSSAFVPTLISTIILAPIVEEMIYRKAIFSVFKAYSVIPAYITSIVLFTLPHMLSTSSNFGTWLLMCLPYAICGFMLCLIYHKSKYNIYASIAAHMLNNIVAVILAFI